ncbi:MAG: hypothetical protein A3K60_06875 [Euryarchaeota archaeon RBG_19FT_COMBO_56_21]|nr:MAG: hypothetical protein A3K60_06875 [Euryarchaeota archaeon RBG_19FT_COMBO_56_21]
MKCPSCGAENADYVIFCGQCATQIRKPDPSRAVFKEWTKQSEQLETPRNTNVVTDLSLIAIAVNVRRIFILIGLGIILTIGTSLISLWISISDYDVESAQSLLRTWLLLATAILIAGLLYAIFQKRLTRASASNRTRL